MARIPPEKIDEIKAAVDIVSYVSRYVRLKKSGQNMFGLCPFHQEKTPSFSVSPAKQIYHCFGCQKGGDAINFLMEIEKISYIEAIRRVAFDLGIAIPEETENYQKSTDVYDALYSANQLAMEFFTSQLNKNKQNFPNKYLKNRKLKLSTISKFAIGFAPNKWDALLNNEKLESISKDVLLELGLIQKKDNDNKYFDRFRNRLMFPFHNISGRIIGFGGRRLNEDDNPKYLNSPESKIYKKGEILYGLYQAIPAIRDKNVAILVEGYFDLLRLVNSGIENVVASSGTALTENQGRLLKRYTSNVIISYDSDEAGLKSAIRNSDILESLDLHVSIIQIPTPHDPDSYILEAGKKAYFDLLKNKKNPFDIRLQKFFADNPNPTLDQKNEYIDDIITELIRFPNEIKIGYYLHKLAENLEISESLLVSRFNKIKKKRHLYNSQRINHEKETEKKSVEFKRGEWRAEEGILAAILNGKPEIIKQLLNSLSSTDFENEDLKSIFEIIMNYWEENNQLNIKKIQDDLNPEQQRIISRLSFSEVDNIEKFANDCIYRLKKWNLNTRYSEIRRMLQEESTSPKSVDHYMKELSQLKKKLIDIENEYRPKSYF